MGGPLSIVSDEVGPPINVSDKKLGGPPIIVFDKRVGGVPSNVSNGRWVDD